MLPHWTEAFVTIDEREFHYIRTGQGDKPPLLLLHGFSDNGLCWLPVARDLQAEYDVILPDAGGHGRSARVQPEEQVDNVADAAALILALDLHQLVVGGHSMGGLTATELGARFPSLAGGLILEDPAWIDPPPDDAPEQENSFSDWFLMLEKLSVDEIMTLGKADNPQWPDVEFPAWAESKRQLDKNIFQTINFNKPWREFVAALTVPTLLITADVQKNAIISPAVAQEAAALSPFVQVAAVPNAGHNIRRENYPAYMNAVNSFLTRLRKKDPA